MQGAGGWAREGWPGLHQAHATPWFGALAGRLQQLDWDLGEGGDGKRISVCRAVGCLLLLNVVKLERLLI